MNHRQNLKSQRRPVFYSRIPRILSKGVLLWALATASCGDTPVAYLDVLDLGSTPVGSSTGLPCDVSQVLQQRCISCHGSPPAGAPISLVSYADITAASAVDPAKKVIERAVIRMQDTASPMPPGGGAAAADIQVLQSFITAGLPMGSCGGSPSPAVCTSGKSWTGGNNGSASMNPGVACIACHATNADAPKFQIAGTVYPTAHEPDLCLGTLAGAGVTIEITDASGRVVSLVANSSGNFSYRSRTTPLQLPYTAKVKQGTKVRAMSAAQMSGDCNSCHTQSGLNGAPGRIMAP